MSDIVKCLRSPHEWGRRAPVEGWFIRDNSPLLAADEIERLCARINDLEALLRLIKGQLGMGLSLSGEAELAKQIASALKDQSDE